ncbi:carboxypeptidase-like regulatory domain-containing protein [Occallatibacter riparius]|uniref:Carboxypeptidase-like regulatory domain-containing protein n=1 Tax=Occallatibacter riparius TaxID=1002689 RepID=A0A9J7BQU1_9BACT|nr:carboxypeptidase-like regulatory domain-containing protein [Occallatibacter riparius]UWZ84106.1 carboxypeptidase-like regulatory domain-containing protein [Occallatibacter riparius]
MALGITTQPTAWQARILLCALLAVSLAASAQQTPPTDSNAPLGTAASVHGVVMNAASGEPLPRALVQINGGSGQAVLTDGDGRFEISGLPQGPNVFMLTKPGFEDAAGAEKGQILRDLRGYTHDVYITSNTPALTFSMRPTNSIRGHIELSTGDVALNIGVTLLQRQIHNGRASWRNSNGTRTNADGNFHFAHLDDGDYVVKAGPAPEAELSGNNGAVVIDLGASPTDNSTPNPNRARLRINGYPEIYFPDAREFSGAAHFHLEGGEQSDAGINLPLEAFHAVNATVVLPAELRAKTPGNFINTEVLGPEGQQVPYGPSLEPDSGQLSVRLPDGSYTIRVSAMRPNLHQRGSIRVQDSLAGQADVTVAGRDITKRIAVGPMVGGSLQVMVTRTAQGGTSGVPGHNGEVFVEIAQASPLNDGMQSVFAQGSGPGAIETVPPAPGKYWVHTIIADSSLCEDSFTAGSSNLGREPLVVGQGGATAPLTLNLRDNCGNLKVSLPSTAAGLTAGEEPSYTIYLVPDFDTTADAASQTLRASTNSSFTFTSLTPGSYHVYAFAAPVNLEYRNRDVLAQYHGQPVTVAPGANTDLVLEVPAQ